MIKLYLLDWVLYDVMIELEKGHSKNNFKIPLKNF
jgi:hypothetical protein